MSHPKGKLPSHIQPKKINHSSNDLIILVLSEADSRGDVTAIDGKTLLGSRGWFEEDKPLHLLHAWRTEYGICLSGSVDKKSNEITAFPQLIESLELKGTIVTTNAFNTQKKAAEAVISKNGQVV